MTLHQPNVTSKSDQINQPDNAERTESRLIRHHPTQHHLQKNCLFLEVKKSRDSVCVLDGGTYANFNYHTIDKMWLFAKWITLFPELIISYKLTIIDTHTHTRDKFNLLRVTSVSAMGLLLDLSTYKLRPWLLCKIHSPHHLHTTKKGHTMLSS